MTAHRLVLGTIAALFLAAPALAQPLSLAHAHHGGDMLPGVSLTAQQKAEWHLLRDSRKPAMTALFRQQMALHRQLREAWLDGAGSAQLSALMEQEQAVHARMDAERLSLGLRLRDLLTPAQLAQAKATAAKLETLHAQEHALLHGTPPTE